MTSSNYSEATLHIKPAGQYSRLIIETYSLENTRKNIGGDWWRVLVNGASSVPVTILDNMDGTYEVSFLILEPGEYSIELYLEYTLCDGLKNPPDDFFSKGNAQGKAQSAHALPGYNEKPYLEQKYSRDLFFRVQRGLHTIYKELYPKLRKPHESCLMWDGFGQWTNNTNWKPYIKEPFMIHSLLKTENKEGIFWIHQDSLGDHFYKAVLNTSLCANTFRGCKRTYNWAYNLQTGKKPPPSNRTYNWMQNLQNGKKPPLSNHFNMKRVLDELEEVLTHPEMDSENSVLYLNYGLHFVMGVSFEIFQTLINALIKLLKSPQNRFKGTVIWRTNTAIQKWKFGTPQSNRRHQVYRRFFTEQRVELYNAFSTSKMCEAGFKILDVFPMSYSYPNGTGVGNNYWDSMHYNRQAFLLVEQYLHQGQGWLKPP